MLRSCLLSFRVGHATHSMGFTSAAWGAMPTTSPSSLFASAIRCKTTIRATGGGKSLQVKQPVQAQQGYYIPVASRKKELQEEHGPLPPRSGTDGKVYSDTNQKLINGWRYCQPNIVKILTDATKAGGFTSPYWLTTFQLKSFIPHIGLKLDVIRGTSVPMDYSDPMWRQTGPFPQHKHVYFNADQTTDPEAIAARAKSWKATRFTEVPRLTPSNQGLTKAQEVVATPRSIEKHLDWKERRKLVNAEKNKKLGYGGHQPTERKKLLYRRRGESVKNISK